MNATRKFLLSWLTILASMIAMFGCVFISNLASTPAPQTSTNASTEEMGQETAPSVTGTGEATSEPDPLDHLLTLRSVQIDLTCLHPGGAIRSINVEIDSVGNMRVTYSSPLIDPAAIPTSIANGGNLSGLPTSSMMYIVDGNAYKPSDQNPNWMATPAETGYIATLSAQMHNLDLFTTWLDILPEGSLQPAGSEAVGGMDAKKYTVSGDMNGQSVTGALWYEPQADALAQAELHVPAALFSGPNSTTTGEYLFKLTTKKADVPPVVLPGTSSGSGG